MLAHLKSFLRFHLHSRALHVRMSLQLAMTSEVVTQVMFAAMHAVVSE